MEHTIRDLKAKVKEQGFFLSKPISPGELQHAQAAGFPDVLLDFYRQCDPYGYMELKQRICSIDDAFVENTDAVPGCALSPHGFIVFATTKCGDAYCIDTNVKSADGHHPVVLFSHEMIEEDGSLSEIQALRVEVASSLEDFLKKFMSGTLCEEPSYG